jgi:hypothetical protein
MKATLLDVHGFHAAVYGTRLSKNNEVVCNAMFTDDDLALLTKLSRLGPSHAKFLRVIQVWMSIKAPRYWWSEFDTYKVGTTALSQSTMHTLMKRELSCLDFEPCVLQSVISSVNAEIKYGSLEVAKANLPEGFLQTRMVNANYQVLKAMYHDRKNHKLEEWREFCEFIETLPHATLITGAEEC